MPKLSSETFSFNNKDNSVQRIADKMLSLMCKHSEAFPGSDIELTVTFSKNFSRKETLEGFTALVEANKPLWKKYSYTFDFKKRKYLWGKKEIHLTSSEEFALYRHLVLEVGIGTGGVRQALTNARRRLGLDFLTEAIP